MRSCVILLLVCLLPNLAGAWHSQGHVLATELAVEASQAIMPAFFVQGIETIKHCSVDPDVFKFKTDSRLLSRKESPNHYFDLELFDDEALPETREDFWWWCLRHSQSTGKVGLLPYAIAETTYMLSIALAEHHRWPDNQAIQSKCLVYAGLLSHYAEDACMPLHATVHWDGRVLPNGQSPHTGIHRRVDGLLHRVPGADRVTVDPNSLVPFQSLLAEVFAHIQETHSLVEPLYALEDQIPALDEPFEGPPELVALVEGYLHRSARFTARLYVTALKKSALVTIPDWHERENQ